MRNIVAGSDRCQRERRLVSTLRKSPQRLEASAQNADPIPMARGNAQGAEIWKLANFAIDIGLTHNTLAHTDCIARLFIARHNKASSQRKLAIPDKNAGLTFEAERKRPRRCILAKQTAHIAVVFVSCHGETVPALTETLAQATSSSEPCHVGSPNGKRSRIEISFLCIALIMKKFRNMNALARLTWSRPRLSMPVTL